MRHLVLCAFYRRRVAPIFPFEAVQATVFHVEKKADCKNYRVRDAAAQFMYMCKKSLLMVLLLLLLYQCYLCCVVGVIVIVVGVDKASI